MHSCDIIIILGASSEYSAAVFKHSELILFCHSALQDVHLLAVIRESKLKGSSFQGLVSLLAPSLHSAVCRESHVWLQFYYAFFSPITKTDIPTSEYSSAYLYAHLMLLFGGTSRRCPAILWSACDYKSNTSSNMSHWSSKGYIFPWKHAGCDSEKVSQNVGLVGER